MDDAITLEHITKTFAPERGVFDVSFNVRRGEIFGFLGPNGAGKTTLIRILLDYLRAESGSARILGLDCRRDALAIRHRLGYVPAEFKLDEHDTVGQFLAHLASYRPPGALERAKGLAERLELRLEGRLKIFSKGMKQKVALIQALMHAPELLILDEPSEGLDPLVQHTFHGLLREAAAAGTTVFFSSHILPEVEALCDRVAIIGKGRLLAYDTVEALRARRLRRLTVLFDSPEALEGLAIPGAAFLRADGARALFDFSGTPQGLFAALSPLPVVDFTLEPAPLEEAFLEFYK